MNLRLNSTGDSDNSSNHSLSSGQALSLNSGDTLEIENPEDILNLVPQGEDVLLLTKDGSSFLLKNFLGADDVEIQLPGLEAINANSFQAPHDETNGQGDDSSAPRAIEFYQDHIDASLAVQKVTLLALISELAQDTSAFENLPLSADGQANAELEEIFRAANDEQDETNSVDEQNSQATPEAQQTYQPIFESQQAQENPTPESEENEDSNPESITVNLDGIANLPDGTDLDRVTVTGEVVDSEGEEIESTVTVDPNTGEIDVSLEVDDTGDDQQVEVRIIVVDNNSGSVIDRIDVSVLVPDPFRGDNLALQLTQSGILENEEGYQIGSLSASGLNEAIEGPFTYSIVNDPSGLFEIQDGILKLKTGVSIDFEAAPSSYQLAIQIENAAGTRVEKTLSVFPADANEAGDVSDFSISGQEDVAIAFEREAFEAAFSDSDQSDALQAIRIDALSQDGVLLLGEVPVEIGQVISIDQIDALSFKPDADWNGQAEVLWSGSDGELWSEQPSHISIQIENVDDAPVATLSIGPQTANEDAAFSLNIPSGLFSDADANDTLTLSANLPAWLSFDSQTGVISGLPTFQEIGEHRIEIVATDSSGSTARTSFGLLVSNVNDQPSFTPISDLFVTENASVQLDAATSFSDEDIEFGDSLSYAATLSDGSALPEWLSFDQATGKLSGTAPGGRDESLSIQITATDNSGESATSSFTLNVANQNDAPELVDEIEDVEAAEDSVFSFVVADSFADSDFGDTLSFTATLPDGSALPEWLEFDPQTGTFSGTPSNEDVGMLAIRVVASDGALQVEDIFAIMVQNTNDGPIATGIANQTAPEDSPFALDVSSSFSDVDLGDTLSYSATLTNGSELPDWLEFDESTGRFSGTPSNEDIGDLSILVVASDGQENASELFSIEVANTNDGPVATFIPDQTGTEDNLFIFDVSSAFSDVDAGDILTYSATLDDGSHLPSWLNLNAATGELSGTPQNAQTGDIDLVITASDGQASASTNLSINVENTNDAPIVSASIPAQTAPEDDTFNLNIADYFADEDPGDALLFSATLSDGSELPDWLALDPETGDLSGTPDNDDVGSLEVKVTASDGESSVETTFQLEIENTNDGPVVKASILDQTTDEDNAFELDVSDNFQDIDTGDTLAFEATLLSGDPLPDWLSFDEASGRFSGVPKNEDVGAIEVKVLATDGEQIAESGFRIEVENTNDKPIATADAISIAEDGSTATGNLLSNDSDEDASDSISVSEIEGQSSNIGQSVNGSYGSVVVNADGSYTYSIDNANNAVQALAEGESIVDSFTYAISDGNGGVASSTLTITISGTNDAPIATADTAAIAEEGITTTGNVLSNDSDIDASDSLSVSEIDGQSANVGQSVDGSYGSVVIRPDGSYTYSIDNTNSVVQGLASGESVEDSFTYTVSDSQGTTDTQTLTVTIVGTTDDPTAKADTAAIAEDAATTTGNVLTNDFDVDASDTLSIAKIEGDDANIGQPVAGTYGTLTLDSDGEYTYAINNANAAVQALAVGEVLTDVYTYVVSDGEGGVDTETLTVTITGANDAPVVAVALQDQTTQEDAVFSFDASASFADVDASDTLSYSATLQDGSPLPSWLTIDSETGVLSGTPLNEDVGTIAVAVTASDGEQSVSDTFDIEVQNTNDGPVVSAAIQDQTTDEDAAFSFDTSASFADVDAGDILSYSATLQDGSPLPSWLTIDSNTGVLSGTPLNEDVGTIAVAVTASDGEQSVSDTFDIEVENTNDGPVVSAAIQDQTTDEDAAFSFDTSASFADVDAGDTLSYSATLQDGSPLPNWLTIDSATGVLSGTPLNEDVGTIAVAVTASDGTQSVSDAFDIEVQNTNDGPVVSAAIQDQTTDEDAAFSFDTSASFADVDAGDTLSYSATLQDGSPLPNWLTIDSATGVLSGTPLNEDVGTIAVAVTASDGEQSVSDTFDIEVENTNDGPVVSAAIQDQTTDEDAAFSLDTSTSFADVDAGDTLSYSATLRDGSPLPSWLTIDSNTGVLSGTPLNEDVGTIAVAVTASDGEQSVSDTFDIEVQNTNDGPVVSAAIQDQTTDEDAAFSFDTSASFADVDAGDTLSYSATLQDGSPLPNWLTIDSATGVLSGTPLNEDVGTIAVAVTASDGEQSVSDTFDIEVENTNDGPVVSAAIQDQTTDEDAAFSLDTSTSFADVDAGDTLSYSATLENGDPLPTWLSIDTATGLLSGTPENADVGSLSVKVTASDGKASVSDTFTIVVENTNDSPTAVVLSSDAVAENSAAGTVVSTLSASDADASDSHSFAIVDEDGNPAADSNFEIVGNEIRVKSGANLDYESSQTHSLRIKVTDSEGASHTQSIEIDVTNVSGHIIGTANADTLNGTSEDDTIEGQGGNDLLNGGEGDDTLLGGQGADTLTGGEGDDSISGGEGNDKLYIDGDDSSIDGGEGTDTAYVQDTDGASLDLTDANIEYAYGDTGNDTFDATGSTTGTVQYGGAGNDSLTGGDGSDLLSGQDGDDTLTGGQGADTLTGGAGDDSISGGEGNDKLYIDGDDSSIDGGEGIDTAYVQDTDGASLDLTDANIEYAYGDTGNDTFDATGSTTGTVQYGGAGNDSLTGGDGSDLLSGDDGNDTLSGGAGSDTLTGGAGDDSLSGGDGVDFLNIDHEDSNISGGAGTDTATVQGSEGVSLDMTATSIERAYGNDGDDTFDATGSTGGVIQEGGKGDDTLIGGDSNDILKGGDDDDDITGGQGNDNISGGEGQDIARFSGNRSEYTVAQNSDGSIVVTDKVSGRDGVDTIYDVESFVFADATLDASAVLDDAPELVSEIANQTTDEDALFSIDLSTSFTEHDGQALAYSATLENGDPLPTWLSLDSSSGQLSGTPQNEDVGSISITVTASDGSQSVSDTFDIEVENTNDGPVVSSKRTDVLWQEDFSGLSNGAQEDTGDSAWETFETYRYMTPSHGVSGGTYKFSDSTNFQEDDEALTKLKTESIDISGRSEIQLDFDIKTTANMDTGVMWGELFQVRAVVDGVSTKVYELYGNLPNDDGSFQSISISDLPEGDSLILYFEAKATLESEAYFIDNIQVNGDAVGIVDQLLQEDAAFSLNAAASFSDVDATDTLTYSATLQNGDPLPSWLSINATTGELSGTPLNDDVGTISVTVSASDGQATASASFSIQIDNTNDGPVVSSQIADQTTDEDAAFSLDASSNFADVDLGDTLTYSATLENGDPLPDWLSIDSTTGVLSGTPLNDDVGTIAVAVTASDGTQSASDTFSLTVENVNDAPTVRENASVWQEDFSGLADGSQQDDGDSAWTTDESAATDSDPLHGVSNNAYEISLTASEDDGNADVKLQTETIDISSLTDLALSFDLKSTEGLEASGSWNDYFEVIAIVDGVSHQLYHVDGDAPSAGSFSQIDLSSIPDGDELVISFEGKTTNSSEIYTIDNIRLSGDSTSLLDQTTDEDAAFSLDVSSSFADVDAGDTLTYSAALQGGGPLPDWLSIDANTGLLSGTPANEDVGSISITVTASDLAGASASYDFALAVQNTNDSPTVSITATGDELIQNGSFEQQDLATGKVGTYGSDPTGAWTTQNGMELWDNVYGKAASDGDQFVELDYGASQDSISQSFDTDKGKVYNLTFDASARGASTTDVIEVYWNGVLVAEVDPASTSWSNYSFQVVGTGGSDTLKFSEATAGNDGLGAHLDNISVTSSGPIIAENTTGAVVGDVSIADPDAGDAHMVTVSDSRFEVVAGKLKLKDTESLDHGTEPSIDITVTATDIAGSSQSTTINVTVADLTKGEYVNQTAGSQNVTTSTGDDTITTGDSADTIDSGAGDDIIDSGGGADSISAGAGNDTITISALDYDLIDGEDGQDKLQLEDSNITLDFTTFDDAKTKNVEVIDIDGSGGNTIRLSTSDVLNMTDGDNQLFVDGGSDDRVEFSSDYASQGTESINGNSYEHYYDASTDTHLYINSDITDTPTF